MLANIASRDCCRNLLSCSIAAAIVVAILGLFAPALAGKNGGGGIAGSGGNTLATTSQDFFQPGTQPLGAGVPGDFEPILQTNLCFSCHAEYGPTDPFTAVEPMGTWTPSMMAQSARDPLFYAGLAIANQDAAGAGEYCIRCHAPVAYLSGHANPPDASAFTYADQQGVQCNFCHRLVDPVFKPSISPSEDQPILDDLSSAGLLPAESNNSRYTVSPIDVRRGPFNDVPLNIHPGIPQPEIVYSPFHTKAEFCWTCHGVSNGLMSKQPDGTYALNDLDAPHPTQVQTEMFPLHRTFSEWKNSYYSTIGVQHDGNFGGNHPTGIMKDCQDCHMPPLEGYGCNYEFDPFFSRPNVPQHSFIGSNTWVLNAVRTVDANGDGQPDFPDSETGLSDDAVSGALARNIDFLQKASDLTVTKVGSNIKVRLLNQTGHKLPTGFPDGRRMWINVKFLDCMDQIVVEHGAYDFETGALTPDTKVYEMLLGIEGADYATLIGHPEGQTFHFILANKVLKDNRIPPPGFSNQISQQNQTASVGATYLNGQNWDDTLFPIPAGTTKIITTVYFQVTSREFIEYLRDANTTDNRGQVAYDLWVQNGMSTPVVMDTQQLQFYRPQDINHDGAVNVDDLLQVINAWGPCGTPPELCPADINHDGVVNVDDLLSVINAWGPC